MSRSKNSRKKNTGPKKRVIKSKSSSRSATSGGGRGLLPTTPQEATGVPTDGFESSGEGMLTSMRRITGGVKADKTGSFLSRRRTLGEWAIWFGGLAIVYYSVDYFFGDYIRRLLGE